MEHIFISLTKEELQSIISDAVSKSSQPLPSKNQDDILLNISQVATIFSVSKGTINNWRNKGYIKSYNIGRQRRYKKSEIYFALEKFKDNKGKISNI